MEDAALVAGSSANAEPFVAHAIIGEDGSDAEDDLPESDNDDGPHDDGDGIRVAGRVKWFDATRGFGFLVSDRCEGDVLIHFSIPAPVPAPEASRRALEEAWSDWQRAFQPVFPE